MGYRLTTLGNIILKWINTYFYHQLFKKEIETKRIPNFIRFTFKL